MKLIVKKKRIKQLVTEQAISTPQTQHIAGGAAFQAPDTDFPVGQQHTCETT
ncbi:hypothetical protein [Pseudoalteromonas luteoviolacea]|uniref:hypothetical protein n=1 Tax=Pseudoalteromonas luteoviolacea TaxID=43657 RepID=UPI000A5097B8|nr:hypothetical protein [Pseudoalteromonas luteoviolacea]